MEISLVIVRTGSCSCTLVLEGGTFLPGHWEELERPGAWELADALGW